MDIDAVEQWAADLAEILLDLRRPEAILWQRIHSLERLMELLSMELPPSRKAAGTYMARALEVRDQWESRLLRCASWSPLS